MTCDERLLSTVDGGRVLDVGCGNGRSTLLVASSLQSFRSIVGIDPDKDSLDEARRQTDDRRISYRQLSVMDLAPEPKRFDTVVLAYALHHVPDPSLVLTRLASVLESAGRLIVTEPCSDGLTPSQETARDIHHFKARIDRLKGLEHRETYRSDEIRAMIRAAGFDITSECMESPVDEETPEERVQWGVKFLEDYLPFIKGRQEYAELSATTANLRERIQSTGVDSPPQLFIIAGAR